MGHIVLYIFIAAAAVSLGIYIGHKIKSDNIYQINTQRINEEKEKLEQIKKEIESANAHFKSLQEGIESATRGFNEFFVALKVQKEKELKICYDNSLKKLHEDIQKADEEMQLNFVLNKQKNEYELSVLEEEVEKFRAIRRAIIDDQKRAEELENNQKFYMLQISDMDKEDIVNLRKIENILHNKDILNKLIWSSFYQTPYKNLVGRIIGDRKVSGIYKITFIKNGKIYIGKSVDIAERIKQHIKSSLGIDSLAKTQFYEVMKVNGAESFTFELLEEVPKDRLLERESYWIKFYETDSYGFNMKA